MFVHTMLLECVLVLSLAVVVSPITTPCFGCACAINDVLKDCEYLCPIWCRRTGFIRPVCGFNPCYLTFRTFDRECMLERTVCEGIGNLYYKVYDGECRDTPDPTTVTSTTDCLQKCPEFDEPLCGFNPCYGMFKTFRNPCILEHSVCDGPSNLYYAVRKGPCDQDSFQD